MQTRKRGIKICKSCQTENGARAHFCSSCQSEFPVRNKHGFLVKKINKKIDDWKDLKEGECIRVISGTGPYYDRDGYKDSIGHYGKFIVKWVDDNGIVCFGCSKNNQGFVHIYMGEVMQSPTVPSLIRSPHKIIRSKK